MRKWLYWHWNMGVVTSFFGGFDTFLFDKLFFIGYSIIMKDCSSTRSTWALHGGRNVILLWEAQCKQSSVYGAKTKFSRQGRVGDRPLEYFVKASDI